MMASGSSETGIVGRKYDKIAAFASRAAHQGTLLAIPISAASEQRDDPARGRLRLRDPGPAHELPRQRYQVAKRIVGVSVVHNDREGLAHVDGLEAARDRTQREGSLDNLLPRALRERRPRRQPPAGCIRSPCQPGTSVRS